MVTKYKQSTLCCVTFFVTSYSAKSPSKFVHLCPAKPNRDLSGFKFLLLFLPFLFLFNVAFPSTAQAKFRGKNVILKQPQQFAQDGVLNVKILLPPNHHFASDVESTFKFYIKDPEILQIIPQTFQADLSKRSQPIPFSYQSTPGQTIAVLETRIFFCDDVDKICISDLRRTKFITQPSDKKELELTVRIPPLAKRS